MKESTRCSYSSPDSHCSFKVVSIDGIAAQVADDRVVRDALWRVICLMKPISILVRVLSTDRVIH